MVRNQGATVSDISKHIAVSKKVDYDDLDWARAREYGLSAEEVEWLSYFADIESQTVFYFLEFAKLKVARNSEFMTFLTMWNYEEYFHSHAITRLIEECGVEVEGAAERATKLRGSARLKAKLEDWVQVALATATPESFVALWMTWGATQELLTTQAYERIANTTKNPVCEELCRRIAKQERRHFAYYYGQARTALEGRPLAQRITRFIVEKMWSPVGNGVKTPEQAATMAASLFSGPLFAEALGVIDKRIGALPGMEGLDACRTWAMRMGMETPAARAGEIDAADKVAQAWAQSA